MKKLFIIIILLNFSEFSFSQNLVPNPSFEENDSCPNSFNILSVSEWYNPTYGNPSYFNSCDTSNVFGVPINIFGYQYAEDGSAYISLFTWYDSGWGSGMRDYAQVKLKTSLVSGRKYYWCFWVSLTDTSELASNNIGIALSDTSVSALFPHYSNNYSQSLVYDNYSSIINDKVNWTKLSGQFTASGGERYLIIGNFYTNSQTSTIVVTTSPFGGGDGGYGATYYIDNVYLGENDECSEPKVIIPNIFTPNADGINDVFLLDFPFTSTKIYNRWGELVFEVKNNGGFWDGRTTTGKLAPSGTYFYIIETKDNSYKGTISLLR